MSNTRTEEIEFTETSTGRDFTTFQSAGIVNSSNDDVPASAVEAIPDGGYGWTVVFACSVVTFMITGWTGSWGIIQTALIQKYPTRESAISLSFVGTLSIALCVSLGLASVRLSQLIGARYSMLLGVLLMSFGILCSSFTVDNLGGLFVAPGIAFGLGCSLTYTMSNNLPVQWFSSKLGTANGLVKLGGGLGATIMAVAVQALIDRVGIPWTLRILGLVSLASGVPAALLVRERFPSNNASFINLSLFNSMPFCCLFLAGQSVPSRSLFHRTSCHYLPTRSDFQLQLEQALLQLLTLAQQLGALELGLPVTGSAPLTCSY